MHSARTKTYEGNTEERELKLIEDTVEENAEDKVSTENDGNKQQTNKEYILEVEEIIKTLNLKIKTDGIVYENDIEDEDNLKNF